MRATKTGRWERFSHEWLNFDAIMGVLVFLFVAGVLIFVIGMVGFLIYKDSQMNCKPGYTRFRAEDGGFVCSNKVYALDWDTTYIEPASK